MKILNYCPGCNNLLVPKDDHLYCRVCDKNYKLVKDEEGKYRNVKTLNSKGEIEATVVSKDLEDSISQRDRKSHEDYFGTVEE